jgi:AraC-like DNA-binding protein
MHHDTFTASFVRGPTEAMHAKWRYRGAERSVSRGDVQLMEPGEVHSTTAVSEPASFFVVWWKPELIKTAASELGVPGLVHLREAQLRSDQLSSAFSALDGALERADCALAVEHWFAEVTTRVLELATERRPCLSRLGPDHPAIRRARQCIEGRFHETVSLDELAREAGLSKFHLARTFTDNVGMPPHRYQMMLRLRTARRRIEAGDPIKQVASLCGFADESHLTRIFRRWFGVAPGVWRRAMRTPLVLSLPTQQ